MTLPHERKRAVLTTRDFLWSLLDRKITPGVPTKIRELAHRLLRHYPMELDLQGPSFSEEDLP